MSFSVCPSLLFATPCAIELNWDTEDHISDKYQKFMLFRNVTETDNCDQLKRVFFPQLENEKAEDEWEEF